MTDPVSDAQIDDLAGSLSKWRQGRNPGTFRALQAAAAAGIDVGSVDGGRDLGRYAHAVA